jgi:hypothetical protein
MLQLHRVVEGGLRFGRTGDREMEGAERGWGRRCPTVAMVVLVLLSLCECGAEDKAEGERPAADGWVCWHGFLLAGDA